ncbi:MAG TPA: PTS mannitol transporter subunit IIABC, partial [Synergistetes bacterium]|nr:PTS mannitol transporter subunit IIABC [Synergistota bacterium]
MAHYLFLTGQLAAPSLRSVLEKMEPPFEYDVHVMPITVAALAECGWISRHLPDADGYDAVYIPGLCQGPISLIQEVAGGTPVKRGPDHLKDLPGFFDLEGEAVSLEGHDITILAEIVDAHLLSDSETVRRAHRFREDGADIIDLGGPVSGKFPGVEGKVRLLRGEGFRVSVDTFDGGSLRRAAEAGAELLLSVNGSNIDSVLDLGCRVVVIPDFRDRSLDSLESNIEVLESAGVPYLADPVLDPFPFGLVGSLERYIQFRRLYPDTPMLMGIGNQTELMEADSSGVNAMMAAICTELSIDAVLTTSVVSWAEGAVAEFDRARRLMFWSRDSKVLPKHAKAGL